MLKKTLYFSSSGSLSIQNGLLFYRGKNIEGNDISKTFPLEDLGLVVIESLQMTISTFALHLLAKNNCSVIFCDNQHLPSGQIVPYSGNSLTQKCVEIQINANKRLVGKLWQQTVQAKIKNQASVLEKFGHDFLTLLHLANEVKNGDPGNREAIAAYYYFHEIGEGNFTRNDSDDYLNAALNYGYSILRAAMARALTGSGLLPCIGIHHSNQYDAYTLADDIMEPYRPYVDDYVFSQKDYFHVPKLQKEHKTSLLKILTMDVDISCCRRPLMNALSITTASLVKCFAQEEKFILYPVFQTCQHLKH